MVLPYKRNFNKGRQSEQLFNDEMHKTFESVKHISEQTGANEEPEIKMHGALWRDDRTNELKYCNTMHKKWEPVFSTKFQIIDNLLSEVVPSSPIAGQLWLHNQVLYYFDGSQWMPIKAMQADDSQFSQSAFADFSLISPLSDVGDKIAQIAIDDDFISHYYEGNADYKNDNEFLVSETKWSPEWENSFPDPQKSELLLTANTQYIIPNVTYDKFFVDRTLRRDFEKISSVCLQYPTKDVIAKTQSAVHLNVGKLTNAKKRLIKVNKQNPTINVSAYNTEFYGYRSGEYLGDFLIPSDSIDKNDYIIDHDKIILNYGAAQNYDYVLAVTYEFGWIRDTGSEKILTNKDVRTGYFINNMRKPIDVFVNGLNLEDQYFTADASTSSVEITDPEYDSSKHTIDFMSSVQSEFGYIRDVDIENRGIIKLTKRFLRPLVFINGQCMHPSLDGLIYNNDTIVVPGAKINTPWSVIELNTGKTSTSLAMLCGIVSDQSSFVSFSGTTTSDPNITVNAGNIAGTESGSTLTVNGTAATASNVMIQYPDGWLLGNDSIILFVNGLLVSKNDIVLNRDQHTVSVIGGMDPGAQFVLLRDSNHYLYDNLKLLPAMNVGRLDSAMIYIDGKLITDDAPILESVSKEKLDNSKLSNGEVKFFIPDKRNSAVGTMMIYDSFYNSWMQASDIDIAAIKKICGSYTQAVSSVQLNVEYASRDFCVYAIKYANTISDTLKIGRAILDHDDTNPDYNIGLNYYRIADQFIAGKNMLNVFVNGVKQIGGVDYIEQYDGYTIRFTYPEKVLGADIVYVVEGLENGSQMAAVGVVLTESNMISTNVYQIPDDKDISFFPGRLSVYVNGVRIAKEDWTLLGNKTIMIRNTAYPLIAPMSNTYPKQTYAGDPPFTVTHQQSDVVYVEIRQEFERQEMTFSYDPDYYNEMSVDTLHIPSNILETKDEVLIFMNGLFTGLTIRDSDSYHVDQYKGCLTIDNASVLSKLNIDPLYELLKTNDAVYNGWKIRNNKTEYVPDTTNNITIMWR